jgi:hypothetical protein
MGSLRKTMFNKQPRQMSNTENFGFSFSVSNLQKLNATHETLPREKSSIRHLPAISVKKSQEIITNQYHAFTLFGLELFPSAAPIDPA